AFATIEMAIEQGRVIFNNIRKFIVYLLSGNVGEILAVAAAAAVGIPLPLLPLQILYLNLINDVFPALALGVGPGGEAVMDRPPRDPDEPFLRRAHWGVIGSYGLVIAATVLGSFWIAYSTYGMSEQEAVTVSFLTLSFGRLWHAFNMRDHETTLLNNEVVKNPWMWGGFAVSLVLLAVAIWVEPLADILEVTPPSAQGWTIIAVASLIPLVAGQIYLTIRRLVGST
ncbi:MAG: cation transporting ATPase C-terminal domain-containing protein, partial [Persicimonas sp.]